MASNDPIGVTLTAKDGTNHIYISSDTTLNELTLTLTNTTTADLIFQQYTSSSCAIGALPATNSGVYLLFNGLLPSTVISGIRYNSMGWTMHLYNDAQNGYYLVFVPDSNITLAAGSSLIITLQLPAVTGSANSGYFSCQYVNALANGIQSGGEQLFVSLVYPPHSADSSPAALPIQFEFIDTNVVFRYSGSNKGAQRLNFRITNTSSAPLVPVNTLTEESPVPQFTLSFVQDNNSAEGSFLTSSQAMNVNVGTDILYGNPLDVTPDYGTNPVTWVIATESSVSPSSNTVLGIGKSASATFTITGIQTSAMYDTITMAILEYSGFPGYEDGQVTAEILIANAPVAKPVINSFSASANSVNIKNIPYNLTLTYNISNTSFIELYNGHDLVGSPITSLSQGTDSTLSITLNAASVFTLKAYNSENEFVTSTILVNVDTVPIGTIMMWSGHASTVPAQWAICDGRPGTPNLTEKFILGAMGDSPPNNSTTNYYLNQTGGGFSHKHNSISTNATSFNVSDGQHQHYMNFDGNRDVDDSGNSSSANTYFHGGNSGNHDTWMYTETDQYNYDGHHSHTINIPILYGTTSTDTVLPPYHALYFIIKVI